VKKKAYADSSADLSIRHQKVAFGFPFSSSSSIFFNPQVYGCYSIDQGRPTETILLDA